MPNRLWMLAVLLLFSSWSQSQILEWKNALLPKEAVGKPATTLLDEKGQPRYRIVLPKEASAKERYAAKELQDRLNSFGPWTFETVDDSQPQRGPELRVGTTVRSGQIPDGVGFDGISIQAREDGSIEMQGGSHRGLVNAIYTFLEEDLGYRYWDRQQERLPSAPLSFIPCSRTHTPVLEWREPFMTISFYMEWSLRNRTDSPNSGPPPESGGYYKAMGFCHTLPDLIPASKYFKDHPDWFEMRPNGERFGSRQHCETNSELADELIRVLLAKIEKEITERDGEPKIVHVSKKDGGGTCQCPECKAINEREGTDAASLLTLVNRVARGIGEKYPNIRIMTFAYLETEVPPKTIRPEPNVCMEYCNTKNAWRHCLIPVRNDSQVVMDISRWKPLSPMYIWDYSLNYDHYLIPLPNLAVVQDNIRFWIENNVKGLMTQGAYHPDAHASERDRLRAWMYSKLMWNPNLDWKELMRDFAVAYFGPAAEPMLTYYMLLENRNDVFAGQSPMNDVDIRYGFDAPFLTDDFLGAAEVLFRQAHVLAGNDKVIQDRIDRDEMPVIYALMGRQLLHGVDRGDYDQLRERLKRIAKANDTVTIAEKTNGKLVDFLEKFPKAQSKAPRQVLFEIDGATVVRLDAMWKVKAIGNGALTGDNVKAEAAAAMGDNVDESGWLDYNASIGKGWRDQGIDMEKGNCVFRQHFMLNAPKAHSHWYLVIPGIDEFAWFTFNGTPLREQTTESTGLTPDEAWNYPYVQEVTDILRLGFAPNLLAIRVLNVANMGGIYAGAYLVGSDGERTPKQIVNLIPDDNPYGRSHAFK